MSVVDHTTLRIGNLVRISGSGDGSIPEGQWAIVMGLGWYPTDVVDPSEVPYLKIKVQAVPGFVEKNPPSLEDVRKAPSVPVQGLYLSRVQEVRP